MMTRPSHTPLRMVFAKLTLLLLFGPLTLHCATVPGEKILEAWSAEDWTAIGNIRDSDYFAMVPAEVTKLLPLLTNWLPIREALENQPDQSWRTFKTEHDWTPFLNRRPPDDPLRLRWGRSMKAASTLRALSEKRLVNDPEVLPILAAGVAHPSSGFTGRDCFYSLTALTKLYDGPGTSWGNIDSTKDPKAIQDWFEAWLAANKGKSLIVTLELEAMLKRKFLETAKAVESVTTGSGHSLHGFTAATDTIYHCVGEPLFAQTWNGETFNSFPGSHGKGAIFICVRPASPLITNIAAWNRIPSWDTARSIAPDYQRVHQEQVKDTDWVIEIYTQRLTAGEVRDLSKKLASPLAP